MATHEQPQIVEYTDNYHTVQFGWIDAEGGYMRIEPTIQLNEACLKDTLESGAARLSSEVGDEEVLLLDEIEPIVGTHADADLGGGTLFWIRVDSDKSPDTTLEERNERAMNVAKILVAHASAAASLDAFKKLF